MLTKKDILEILKELILEHDYNRLGLEYSDIHLDSTLMDNLGFDSLDVTELCAEIEDKLDIHIDDCEVENVMMKQDVEGLMNYLYDRYLNNYVQEV